MKNKSTEELISMLGPYLDGELSPYEMFEMREALKSDAKLQSEYNALLSLREDLRASCQPRISEKRFEGLAAAVAKGVAQKGNADEIVELPTQTVSAKFRIAVGVVAAIVLVVLLSFGYGFTRGVKSAGSVKVNEIEVEDGSAVKVISPEGANYSVIRVTRKKAGNVVINEVETADGFDYGVEVDPESGNTTIRLIENK